MLRAFVEELLRSLEPGDVVDRWCWRLLWLFLVGLWLFDVVNGG